MLPEGFAATWYQGMKSTVTDWKEATKLLKTTFGPNKPPYRVYRELFAYEQDSRTKTDVLICKARSILAQLPSGTLAQEVQLDMVYGLLHRRIREKVPRDEVSSFEELLTQSRLAEETFDSTPETKLSEDGHSKNKKRCSYCHNPGHIREDCRKLAKAQYKGCSSV
ncbi:activity-regulated cytoskeleton associated protein 1-like [Leptinotarsa decemlineata]|uniref:activity-regulated cytoskeleton associated protein 1-like n=1 Tax=Leptinotarsa decemlineata TaxID=7539 RepID=UPI003D3044C7